MLFVCTKNWPMVLYLVYHILTTNPESTNPEFWSRKLSFCTESMHKHTHLHKVKSRIRRFRIRCWHLMNKIFNTESSFERDFFPSIDILMIKTCRIYSVLPETGKTYGNAMVKLGKQNVTLFFLCFLYQTVKEQQIK